MNAARRKHLEKIDARLDEIFSELQVALDEETDSREALPESLHEGERAQRMEEIAEQIEAAQSSVQEARDSLSEAVSP